MQTLPDLLAPELDIVSIGLNPSLPSVRAGFYFANPRNRFWAALNDSGLVGESLQPGAAAIELLFRVHRIGWTDVVKRSTAGASGLRAADFRRDAPLLGEKLCRYQPRIAWFHGKLASRYFLQYSGVAEGEVVWGEQAWRIGASRVFVTPNPSPANAAYSLNDLIDHYRELARLRDELRR